jgi:hypothetical protein
LASRCCSGHFPQQFLNLSLDPQGQFLLFLGPVGFGGGLLPLILMPPPFTVEQAALDSLHFVNDLDSQAPGSGAASVGSGPRAALLCIALSSTTEAGSSRSEGLLGDTGLLITAASKAATESPLPPPSLLGLSSESRSMICKFAEQHGDTGRVWRFLRWHRHPSDFVTNLNTLLHSSSGLGLVYSSIKALGLCRPAQHRFELHGRDRPSQV